MCDEFVKNKLITWGFEELCQLFTDADIDEEAFHLLDNSTMQQLIPTLGKLLKFKRKHEIFLKEKNKNTEECFSPLASTSSFTPLPSTSSFTPLPSTSTSNSTSYDSTVTYHSGEITPINDLDFMFFENENIKELVSVSKVFSENINSPTVQVLEAQENIGQNIDNKANPNFIKAGDQLVHVGEKRPYSYLDKTDVLPNVTDVLENEKYPRKTHANISSVFPNGLRELLVTDIEGRQLLNRKELDAKCRQVLTKIIINYLLNESKYGRISTQTFELVSKEIEVIFPGENARTYFIPYKPKTKLSPKILSKGRLWSRYINFKKRSLSEKNEQEESNSSQDETSDTENKDIEKHINIIKQCIEYTPETKKSFELTFHKRKCQLMNKDPHEYLNLYPVLRTSEGYKFLLDDFDREYPGKQNCLYEKWPNLSEKIIKLAQKQNIRIDTETDDINILSLKILPQLFSPYTVRKKTGKCFRPSRLEILNSFLLHVQTPGEIPVKLEIREKKLMQAGLTLQPFLIIVGKLDDIQISYVAVNKILYKIALPLASLDICFKIFFALKTHYPAECKHLWTFIQQEIYDIRTEWDIDYPSVATLSKDLNNIV